MLEELYGRVGSGRTAKDKYLPLDEAKVLKPKMAQSYTMHMGSLTLFCNFGVDVP